MKNRILKNLINFLIVIFFTTISNAQEINFEAENIETIDDNIISATNKVIITDTDGVKIFSDKLLIDKE